MVLLVLLPRLHAGQRAGWPVQDPRRGFASRSRRRSGVIMLNLPTAEDFRVLRAKLDWTQTRMAEEFGVSQQTYARWETGALPAQVKLVAEKFAALASPRKAQGKTPKPDGRLARRAERRAELRKNVLKQFDDNSFGVRDKLFDLATDGKLSADPNTDLAKLEAKRIVGQFGPHSAASIAQFDRDMAILIEEERARAAAPELEREREKRAMLLEKLESEKSEDFP